MYLIERRAVRSCYENCEVSDLRKGCMEFVMRIARYLKE